MNRKIKVRAWDKDNLEMYYSDREYDDGEWGKSWCFDGDEIWFEEYNLWHTIEGGEDVEHEGWHKPNQEVMQFTGLHDKNGKEIYEGDIIKFVSGTTVFGRIFKIVWKGWGFVGEDFGGNNLLVDYNHIEEFDNCEIVGNVFENPELMGMKVTQ